MNLVVVNTCVAVVHTCCCCYFHVATVTNIEQRHANPAIQPTDISELSPCGMIAFIKRSFRCKVSDKRARVFVSVCVCACVCG